MTTGHSRQSYCRGRQTSRRQALPARDAPLYGLEEWGTGSSGAAKLMDLEGLRLAELICARVCHDVGGLVGTLAGMLELAQEEGGGEAVVVGCEAADVLVRRLRLLRAALGPISEPLDTSGIADLAAGLDERLRVDVSDLGSSVLPAEQARLALAMLLLGAEALPMGGKLHLSANTGGVLRVVASGPRAAWPPSVVPGIAGAPPEGARTLLAPLCGLLARTAGMSLAAEEVPLALCATPVEQAQS